MNISRISNCRLSFKSGNPPIGYRVQPFSVNGSNVELQMPSDESLQKRPAIAFYDKKDNLCGPDDAKY